MTGRRGFIKAGAALGLLRAWPAAAAPCDVPGFAVPDRIDQGPQPVEVGQAGRPIDVFRMPRFRCNAAVERLTDLADHHQLVDEAAPKRSKNFAPGLRKGLVTGPENIAKLQPRVGRLTSGPAFWVMGKIS